MNSFPLQIYYENEYIFQNGIRRNYFLEECTRGVMVACPNRRFRRGVDPAGTWNVDSGPWIERRSRGLVTESPLTSGRYEVLDKQLAQARTKTRFIRSPGLAGVLHTALSHGALPTRTRTEKDERRRKRRRTSQEGWTEVEGGHRHGREKRRRDGYVGTSSTSHGELSPLAPASPLSLSRTTLRRIPPR